MSSRSGWNAALVAIVVASAGACVSDPDPEIRTDEAISHIWTDVDTACVNTRLSSNGDANGKRISLASAPLSCGPTAYTSASSGTYGQLGCDGYIIELVDVAGLPRAGETVRIVDGVSPKLLLTLGQTDCEGLKYGARVYVHSTVTSGWSLYDGSHQYSGKWTGFTCQLTRTSRAASEIPPFPAAADRDKIRIAVKTTSNGRQLGVSAGVKLGTCPPSPTRPVGAFCDADDECTPPAVCGAGICCGSTAKEAQLCDWQDLLHY